MGGCVRIPSLDAALPTTTLCTAALPEETARCFAQYPLHCHRPQAWTLAVCIDGMQLEITTYRLDGSYSDSRRPGGDLYPQPGGGFGPADFTVNAMAYRPGPDWWTFTAAGEIWRPG